jgi:hypothetical protein
MPCLGMFKSKKTEERKRKFYLDYSEDDSDIRFFAVDENGIQIGGGLLFYINKTTGTVTMYGSVTEDLGFDLTEDGELKVD